MEQLMAMYEIPPFNDVHEFLVQLALQRGKLKKVRQQFSLLAMLVELPLVYFPLLTFKL
jgi:hypothetical protein